MESHTHEEKTKKELQWYINHLNTAQQRKLINLIQTFTKPYFTKDDILQLSDTEKQGKIDTALPIDYVRTIQNIHPNFKTFWHCFDYRTTQGELLNIAENFVISLQKTFDIS